MQHVIITGGSSGIGEAFARIQLDKGRAVTLIARSLERLNAAAERLAADNPSLRQKIGLVSADVCDPKRLTAAITEAEARHGPCELLITSAGIVKPGYFYELTPADFENQIAVNYLGTVNAVRAVYRGMARRGSGEILMISSAAGLMGIFGYTAYSASKFALSGFAEALRAEARQRGIRVSICYPPDTQTPQLARDNELKPVETKLVTELGGIMTADAVARKATRSMERGRFAIYPAYRVALLAWFGSFAKPVLARLMEFKIARNSR